LHTLAPLTNIAAPPTKSYLFFVCFLHHSNTLIMPEDDKYDVLEKIGAQSDLHLLQIRY
jgi:hypothetical protein